MSTLPVPRLQQTPSTVRSRLSLSSYSCCCPNGLIFAPFICKKIPFPCTMILWIGGFATGRGDPSLDLRFNFQPVCGFGRAASFNSD